MHLRCKAMMVYGEAFEEDPEYQAGAVDFWCVRTSRGLGPDGGEVSMDCCTDPARPCFQEF
jgi:hypothetical protein